MNISKAILLLSILLTSCSKEPSKINLDFNHQVDGESLNLYSLNYQNAYGNNYNVQLLRYIVTNIELVDADDSRVELDDFHYVDLEDLTSLSLEKEILIPCGDYKSIDFTFGLNEAMNISNSHLSEAVHGAMAWPDQMGGGYHYMRIEGAYIAADESQHFYLTHTGATAGVPRHLNYSIPINLNAEPDVSNRITLNMNINKWYDSPNIYNFEEYDSGIMGNPEAQQIIHENGTDVFSVEVL